MYPQSGTDGQTIVDQEGGSQDGGWSSELGYRQNHLYQVLLGLVVLPWMTFFHLYFGTTWITFGRDSAFRGVVGRLDICVFGQVGP